MRRSRLISAIAAAALFALPAMLGSSTTSAQQQRPLVWGDNMPASLDPCRLH